MPELSAHLNERIPSACRYDVVAPAFLEHTGLLEHIERVGRVIYKAD